MKKINYSDDLRQAWRKSDGDRDTLVAKTALAAVAADANITAKAFVASTREAGFAAAGAVFQAALKMAKEDGANEAGVANAAKEAREKLATDSRAKRAKAKAEKEKLAKAAAEAAAEAAEAALDPDKARALVVKNLDDLTGAQDALANEILRLVLTFERQNLALTQGGYPALDCPVDVNAAGQARLALASDDNPCNGLHAAVLAELKARENAADAAASE